MKMPRTTLLLALLAAVVAGTSLARAANDKKGDKDKTVGKQVEDRFVGKDGVVEKVDALTGDVIARRPPLGTRVAQVLPKGGKLWLTNDQMREAESGGGDGIVARP